MRDFLGGGYRPLAVALACSGLVGPVRAVDEGIYFSEFPVVASVSRLPQRQADAPAAVTVIDREMIKAAGVRDLNDIFRLVPGFQTYPNTTEAARVSYHGLGDGDYSSRVQVLIDGRSMYSPLFGGGVNWATLPVALEDIERIEVVRGTNAVSYGSNAFLGVINIITVDPALTHGVSVATSYGNQNVRDYSLRAGGKIGEVGDFRLTYKQQNDDGLTNRDDWIDANFSRVLDLRADFVLTETDSLQFSAGQAEGISQVGRLGKLTIIPHNPPINDNPIRDLRQTDTYAQMVWRKVLSPTSDLQLRYAYVDDRSTDAFDVKVYGHTYNIDQSGDEGTRQELELQHNLTLAEGTRLVWGASWRDDAMRSAWALPGQGTVHREVDRLFGNLEWKPVRWFTGNAGLAGEDDSLAGFHTSPRLGANFHLDTENTVRLGYSRAYRTGSTVNYLGKEATPLGVLYAGDPNMPAERLDTWEIGYLGDWRAWRSSLDVRLFSERVHDRLFKIDLDYSGANPNIGATTLPIQNVRIRGVEYQFKWQPFETTRFVFNQAWAKIDADYLAAALGLANSTLSDLVKAEDIKNFTEYSMPHLSSSLLLMQKLPWGLDFSLAGYWQDRMKWSTNGWAKRYHRFDARLGYPFRIGSLGGEVAFTVQSLNGAHGEYKADGGSDDRIVQRRQWLSLRLDY